MRHHELGSSPSILLQGPAGSLALVARFKLAMYTAFETLSVITDYQAVLNAGYTAVGVYARPDRCPFEMAQGLLGVGIKLWTVFEEGQPTSPEYFTVDQAHSDAAKTIAWARMVGMPAASTIFAAVDYDAQPSDVEGYLTAFHEAVKAEGFLMGVYGSGWICTYFANAGFAHATWLSGSTGWTGYSAFTGKCDILQVISPKGVLGYSADYDIIRNPGVLWG